MKRLSPQAAMVLAFETAILTLLLSHPLSLGTIAALAGGYWLTGGGGRRHAWIMAALLTLGAWSVVISQGLFYEGSPRTALLTLLPGSLFPFGDPQGLYIYGEGLRYGLVQSIRFSAIVLLGAALLLRYSTDEMAGGLRALRFPGALCFLFSMSLRFFPLIVTEARATWHAQHFRGYRLLPGLWPGNWRAMPPVRVLMLPLMAAQVRKADEIAAALRSRGFSPGELHAGRPAPANGLELALCGLMGLLLLVLGAILLAAQYAEQVELTGSGFPQWLIWLISVVARYV